MGRDGTTGDAGDGHWVDADAFARFAGDDLRRWRPVVGAAIVPADERWGPGVVDRVSWASPCKGVEAFVQVRGRYGTGWAVTCRSETWASHHRRIRVCEEVLDAMVTCSDAALSPDEQAECRDRYAAQFQQQHDERMLERAAQMRRGARTDQDGEDAAR